MFENINIDINLLIFQYFGNIDNVINLTLKIFSIIIIIESIELIKLKKYITTNGIWNDEVIELKFKSFQKENYAIYNKILHFMSNLLKYKYFSILLNLKLTFGVLLFLLLFLMPYSYILSIVFLIIIIKVLIAIKWNGSFNGGSDSMGLVLAIGLLISLIYPVFSSNQNFQIAGLIYINYNLVLSYFRAGIVKLKNKNWLKGRELQIFTQNTIFKKNANEPLIIKLISNQNISKIASLIMIIWEITFVISLFNFKLTLVYICFGIIFHFLNFYIFGLNRFFFNWLATYPSFIYLSILLNK